MRNREEKNDKWKAYTDTVYWIVFYSRLKLHWVYINKRWKQSERERKEGRVNKLIAELFVSWIVASFISV